VVAGLVERVGGHRAVGELRLAAASTDRFADGFEQDGLGVLVAGEEPVVAVEAAAGGRVAELDVGGGEARDDALVGLAKRVGSSPGASGSGEGSALATSAAASAMSSVTWSAVGSVCAVKMPPRRPLASRVRPRRMRPTMSVDGSQPWSSSGIPSSRRTMSSTRDIGLAAVGRREADRVVGHLDTARRPTRHTIFTGGLVMVQMTTGPGGEGRYVAPLGEIPAPDRGRYSSFGPWWSDHVVQSADRSWFSRRDFVLTLRDKEGGGHVDASIDDRWALLTRREGLGWSYETEGQGHRALEGNVALAAVRQIAYEVECTLTSQLPELWRGR
jgi:hypothetical protein